MVSSASAGTSEVVSDYVAGATRIAVEADQLLMRRFALTSISSPTSLSSASTFDFPRTLLQVDCFVSIRTYLCNSMYFLC